MAKNTLFCFAILLFFLCLSFSEQTNSEREIKTYSIQTSDADIHPALLPLSWLFGTWDSVDAEADLDPKVKKFQYRETVEFLPTEQNVLDYRSNTWKDYPSSKPVKQHSERGFLHCDFASNKTALLSSHFVGANEVSEGEISGDKQELTLESKLFGHISYYKKAEIKKLIRKLRREGDHLYFTAYMETTKHYFQKHLEVKYSKRATL